MTMDDNHRAEQELRSLVLKLLAPKFDRVGIDIGGFDLDKDLYESGIIDSFDLVELLADVEKATGLTARLTVDVDTNALTLSINRIVQSLQETGSVPQQG